VVVVVMFTFTYDDTRSMFRDDGLSKFGSHVIKDLPANWSTGCRIPRHVLQGIVSFGAMLSPHLERMVLDPEAAHLDQSWFTIVSIYRIVSNRAAQAAANTVLSLRSTGFHKDASRLVGEAVYNSRLHDASAWWPRAP
jgi:hypothetical protein